MSDQKTYNGADWNEELVTELIDAIDARNLTFDEKICNIAVMIEFLVEQYGCDAVETYAGPYHIFIQHDQQKVDALRKECIAATPVDKSLH